MWQGTRLVSCEQFSKSSVAKRRQAIYNYICLYFLFSHAQSCGLYILSKHHKSREYTSRKDVIRADPLKNCCIWLTLTHPLRLLTIKLLRLKKPLLNRLMYWSIQFSRTVRNPLMGWMRRLWEPVVLAAPLPIVPRVEKSKINSTAKLVSPFFWFCIYYISLLFKTWLHMTLNIIINDHVWGN